VPWSFVQLILLSPAEHLGNLEGLVDFVLVLAWRITLYVCCVGVSTWPCSAYAAR
jgi:hypothetical protein